MTIDTVGAVEESPPQGGISFVARRIAVQGVSAVVAGILVGGLGGRLAMRISAVAAGQDMVGRITDNGNRIGTISLEGTIALVIFGGALFGAVAAVLLVGVRPWLSWAGRWEGLAAGVTLLGIAGSILIQDSNRDFLVLDPAALNVAMFAAIIVGYGWLAVALSDWWLGRGRKGWPLPIHLLVMVPGGVLAVPLFSAFLSESFCGCDDPPVVLGLVLVALAGVTAARFIRGMRGRGDVTPTMRRAGLALTGVAFVLGSVGLMDEILTIV